MWSGRASAGAEGLLGEVKTRRERVGFRSARSGSTVRTWVEMGAAREVEK